jgi:hypothetical protein
MPGEGMLDDINDAPILFDIVNISPELTENVTGVKEHVSVCQFDSDDNR